MCGECQREAVSGNKELKIAVGETINVYSIYTSNICQPYSLFIQVA